MDKIEVFKDMDGMWCISIKKKYVTTHHSGLKPEYIIEKMSELLDLPNKNTSERASSSEEESGNDAIMEDSQSEKLSATDISTQNSKTPIQDAGLQYQFPTKTREDK